LFADQPALNGVLEQVEALTRWPRQPAPGPGMGRSSAIMVMPMFERFTDGARLALVFAQQRAGVFGHNSVRAGARPAHLR
jgi:hypothetical protein